jgi:hypothetical protein
VKIKDRRSFGAEQALGLRQGKAQTTAAIPDIVGENLLHQAARQERKLCLVTSIGPSRHLKQGRLALDIGNDIPQRDKALLLI